MCTLHPHPLPNKGKDNHLDLTKLVGKSLWLDIYCMNNYVSAGNNWFNPKVTDAGSVLLQPFQKTHPVVGKDVSLFHKGEIIGIE